MSILVQDCPRCDAKTMTFNVQSGCITQQQGWMYLAEVFAICRACGRPSIFELMLTEMKSSEIFKNSDAWRANHALGDHFNVMSFVSQKDLAAAPPPDFLPAEIEAAFVEGAKCQAIGCSNAAGTMFRLALDLATRSLLPDDSSGATATPNLRQRRDLGLRIPWLINHGYLLQDLASLAGAIREDGNDGAHAGLLSMEDAEDIQDFTRLLLERLFTEPTRLKQAEERRTTRRQR